MGTYLNTRLNLDTSTISDQILVLVGASEPIDTYRQSEIAGVECPRPRPMMTQWWRDVLKRLESLKTPKWLEAAVVITGANIEQQKELQKKIRSLSKRVKRRRTAPDSDNCLVLLPGQEYNEAIAVLALTGKQFTKRRQLIQELSNLVYAEHPQVVRCAIVAFDVDRPTYPYTTAAWPPDRVLAFRAALMRPREL